jgi:hypothetical protein
MGRHEKQTEEKRDDRLHIRLTLGEKNRLSEKAKERGMSVSDYVRWLLFDSEPLIKRAKPKRAAEIIALGELGKIGSNVNQIAHELHSDRLANRAAWFPDQLIEKVKSGLQALSDYIHKLLDHGD